MTDVAYRGREAREQILLVDDDPRMLDLMSELLERHGYGVRTATCGAQMQRELARSAADLVILDVMMPGASGLTLCRQLAQSGGPAVIMHSAMGEETDRVVGLELGADDYIAKPSGPREVLARVRAVLRRRKEVRPQQAPAGAAYHFAGWSLNPVQRMLVDEDGLCVVLSNGEFHMLMAFLEHPRTILSRETLSELTHGKSPVDVGRNIDVQVSRLRQKISEDGPERIVQTVRGLGYMFLPRVQRT